MASISEEFSGECFDIDRLSASYLRGLVLNREQKEVVSHLLEGKDVFAVLATGFGYNLIHKSFVLAKEMDESSVGCSSGRPFCLVIARGGYSRKIWVGVCGPLPKSLTLFMTKICAFPYPIYDLTKNLIPYL